MSNTGTGFLGSAADAQTESNTSSEPEWEEVSSSRFTAMRYNSETRRLSVRWKNGSTGDYLEVPEDTYARMRLADSLGKFLNTDIIPNYQYVSGD